MSASVVGLFQPRTGWSNSERAQFARIERLLADSGIEVDVEHGLTDEGEPWCVFCSRATGEVVIHAACIDGRFMIDSMVLPEPIQGVSFEACARRFFDDHSLPVPLTPAQRRDTVLMHPSALLASLFLTFMLYAEALSNRDLARDASGSGVPDRVEFDATGARDPGLVERLKGLVEQIAEAVAAGDLSGPAVQSSQAGGQAAVIMNAGVTLAVVALIQDISAYFSTSPDDATEVASADVRIPRIAASDGVRDDTVDPQTTARQGDASVDAGVQGDAPSEIPIDGVAAASLSAEAIDPAAVVLTGVPAAQAEGPSDGPTRDASAPLVAIEGWFSGFQHLNLGDVDLLAVIPLPDQMGEARKGDAVSDAAAGDLTGDAAEVSFTSIGYDDLLAAIGPAAASLLSMAMDDAAPETVAFSEPQMATPGLQDGAALSGPAIEPADDGADRFEFGDAADADPFVEGRADATSTDDRLPGSPVSAPVIDGAAPEGADPVGIQPVRAGPFAAGEPSSLSSGAEIVRDGLLAKRLGQFADAVGEIQTYQVGEALFVIDETIYGGLAASDLVFEVMSLDDETSVTFIGYAWDFDGFA